MEMRTIEALRPRPAPEPVGVVVAVQPEAVEAGKGLADKLRLNDDSISEEDLVHMVAALETLAVALPFGAHEFLEWAVERGSGWPDMDEAVRDYAEARLGMERVEQPVRRRSRTANA